MKKILAMYYHLIDGRKRAVLWVKVLTTRSKNRFGDFSVIMFINECIVRSISLED